ncbi:MAG: hypothetical protein QM778_10660 [Myxococcales bacterium]
MLSLAEVARLVEAAYGPSSVAAALAHQAHVSARILFAEIRAQQAVEDGRLREAVPALSDLRFEEHAHAQAGLPPLAHEQIGDELKHLQRELTRLCVERTSQQRRSDAEHRLATWLGKLDHLVRKLRNELDALALRELPRPGLSRVSGYYYGESLH